MLLPNDAEIAGLEPSMLEAARRHDATAAAKVVIRASAVGDLVLNAARSGAELIVMGTHGRTDGRHAALSR